MTVRYFFGLVLSVIFILFTCFVSGFGDYFLFLLDVSSLIIVIIIPLVFMGIFYGWKKFALAFSALSKKNDNKNSLMESKVFFENYGKVLFTVAFVAFILSFMAMMRNLENREALGPNMAIAAIQLLYAGLINLVVIIPSKIFIKIKITEIENK